jgi:hypothetical protein
VKRPAPSFVERLGFVGVGGHKEIEQTIVVKVSPVGAHAAVDIAFTVRVGSGARCDIDKALVFWGKEIALNFVVGQRDALLAGAIEVRRGDPECPSHPRADPAGGSCIGEESLALVAKESGLERGVVAGRAGGEDRLALLIAHRAVLLGVERAPELGVVSHDQIKPPRATLRLDKGAGSSPGLRGELGCECGIGEARSFFVVEERASVVGREVDIVEAIVVVVADRAAGKLPRERGEHGAGDIHKDAFPRAMKEPRRLPNKQDIQVAIAVVVEKRHSIAD